MVQFDKLRNDLPFGARVLGATQENLADPGLQQAIKQAFVEHGLLRFEDVEQSPQMQLAISKALGPLKDHPVAAVHRSEDGLAPGVIDISNDLDDQVPRKMHRTTIAGDYGLGYFEQTVAAAR